MARRHQMQSPLLRLSLVKADMEVEKPGFARLFLCGMDSPAVFWCFNTLLQAIITHDGRYAQTVILKNTVAALSLSHPMRGQIAPFAHGFFVAPEREREQLVGIGQALKTFNRQKAVDLCKIFPQVCGNGEILAASVVIGWPNFEYDGDHGLMNSPCGADWSLRKLRSSDRMNCSRLANS